MKIEVLVKNTTTDKEFDISELCSTITIDTYLHGQPGKLSCIIQEDPNDIFKLHNGSVIQVIVDGLGMFYGYVFTMGRDASETYKITAYDQLRYLQNKDLFETKNQTASEIFETICKRSELKYIIKHPSAFVCPKFLHINETLYSMIEYGIKQTLISTNPIEYYFIRDEYGVLTFSELSKELTGLVVGNIEGGGGSLLMNYKYEISIDKNTANQILVYQTNEETGAIRQRILPDDVNMIRWGTLRHVEEAKGEMNDAQIAELAATLLNLKNRESKTMKLNAIGLPTLKVGDGFYLSIDSLGIKENMWIENITHTLTRDTHFINMEVFIV